MPEGLTFKRSGNMLILSSGRMTLQTEYIDEKGRDEKNEANELFAQRFTDRYPYIAQRYPVFQDLFDYAQQVSLCTYLKENRVPMLWFLLANREMILTEKSVDAVDALKKDSDHRWDVTIHGGVELEVDRSVRDEGSYEDDAAWAVSHSLATAGHPPAVAPATRR